MIPGSTASPLMGFELRCRTLYVNARQNPHVYSVFSVSAAVLGSLSHVISFKLLNSPARKVLGVYEEAESYRS